MRSIVKPGTIDTIGRLERELEESRRSADAAALREVLAAVARPGQGWLTTGQAAKRLRISIPTVKDWIRRGTLHGVDQGTRWLVSESSVEAVESMRKTLAALEEDVYPTDEELYELLNRG